MKNKTKNEKNKCNLLSKSNIIILVILGLFTIFRVLLALNIPLSILGNQVYDDRLLFQYSLNIGNLHWLGAYNSLTLIKGVTYSVMVIGFNKLLIPYSLGMSILNILSITLLCLALRKHFNKYYLCILYLLLLFSPVNFTTLISQRTYRNAILPAGTILIFASFIGMYLRKNESIKKLTLWSIISSISMIFFWFIKEDSIWILPFTMVLTILTIIYFIINKRKKIILSTFIILLPFICTYAWGHLIKLANYKTYGVYVENDKTGGSFAKMMSIFFKIKDTKTNDRDVWMTKRMLNTAYENSKTFAQLKDYMDTSMAWTRDDGEVNGDLIMWKIRLAMTNNGFYDDAKKADKFCSDVVEELQDAIDKGKIKLDNKIHISAGMKGMDGKDISKGISTTNTWIYDLSKYEGTGLTDYPSSLGDGGMEEFKAFSTLFNSNVANPKESSMTYYGRYIDRANSIVDIYKKLSFPTNILAVISYIVITIKLIYDLFKKKYDNLDTWLIITGVFLSAYLVTLEVALFLDYLGKGVNGFREFYCASTFPLLQIFKYLAIFMAIKLLIETYKEKQKK